MEYKKTLTISIENFYGENEFYEELNLPDAPHKIKDALQRARIFDGSENDKQFIIVDCPLLTEIEHHYLDSPTIEELNFLAKRLGELNEDQQVVLKAVKNKVVQGKEDELISIKDLINLTYGLDRVMVIYGVTNYDELGEFALDNNLIDEVNSVPQNALNLIDKAQIGKIQSKRDKGVFVDNAYVITGDYEFNEIYDGKTLPEQPEETDYVFRIEIAKCPVDDVSEVEDSAEWINLPIDYKEADIIAKSHGEERIEDCVYLGFESVIPQIKSDRYGDMTKFVELNKLAGAIQRFTDLEQAKFKAILESSNPGTLKEMYEITQSLNEYTYDPRIDGAEHYFKNYLDTYLDKGLDRAWLDTLLLRNEGQELMQRLGVKGTDYGFIAPKGHTLYEYVKRYKNPINLSEKFDLIEVCGKTALFTNERIDADSVPDGLNKYDLREGENGEFSTLEKKVLVNHGGTVLTKEPIDIDDSGCVKFTDETSPNFLGDEITLREFIETDYTQTEDEEINKIGDIKQ